MLSHLQALSDFIISTFVIAMSLFLGHRRRRGRRCSSAAAPTEVSEGVESVDRWPRRRLHYYTKVGSRDGGLVAGRAHWNCSPTSITDCAKPNLEPHMEAYRTIDSITDSNEPGQ